MNGVFGDAHGRRGRARRRDGGPRRSAVGQRDPGRADRGRAAPHAEAEARRPWCTPRRRPAPGSRSRTSAGSRASTARSSWSTASRRSAACRSTIDALGIDAAYSGTQKCLSCPPGLSPVTFGPARARRHGATEDARCRAGTSTSRCSQQYWGEERVYHHTAPISMNYALREALRLVLEEGLEARFARHRRNHEALAAGLEALGLVARRRGGPSAADAERGDRARRRRRGARAGPPARRRTGSRSAAGSGR